MATKHAPSTTMPIHMAVSSSSLILIGGGAVGGCEGGDVSNTASVAIVGAVTLRTAAPAMEASVAFSPVRDVTACSRGGPSEKFSAVTLTSNRTDAAAIWMVTWLTN